MVRSELCSNRGPFDIVDEEGCYGGTSSSPAGAYVVSPNERLTKIKLQ